MNLRNNKPINEPYFIFRLTRSIRDSETSIDFVQGPPGSRRERVNEPPGIQNLCVWNNEPAE